MTRYFHSSFAIVVLVALLLVLFAAPSFAQNANQGGTINDPATPQPAQTPEDPAAALDTAREKIQERAGVDLENPIDVLMNAGGGLNGLLGATRGQLNDDVLNGPAADPSATTAASAADGEGLSATLSILLLLTVLTMVPAILVMCTSFTRIIVVLALLRQALGTQQLPPTQVITGLALFLTLLVMAPTMNHINRDVIQPLNAGEIDETEAWTNAKRPLRDFMFRQIERSGNWSSVYTIMEWREPGITAQKESLKREDVDMLTLIPAFMISELKVAFLMGFRLYLPFLVIDMVVSSVLISMGMLMLPPVLISLPFKLLLFVLVDGWNLLVANLLTSFDVPAMPTPAG